MNPSTEGSMMIVVPGVERGVIVFPATLDSAVVTVGDVILAVHRVIRGWVVEHHDGFDVERGEGGIRVGDEAKYQESSTTGITQMVEFGKNHSWVGLSPCQWSKDVWILRTNRALPAIFHLNQRH